MKKRVLNSNFWTCGIPRIIGLTKAIVITYWFLYWIFKEKIIVITYVSRWYSLSTPLSFAKDSALPKPPTPLSSDPKIIMARKLKRIMVIWRASFHMVAFRPPLTKKKEIRFALSAKLTRMTKLCSWHLIAYPIFFFLDIKVCRYAAIKGIFWQVDVVV